MHSNWFELLGKYYFLNRFLFFFNENVYLIIFFNIFVILLFKFRPQIRPNTGFVRQLIAYEEKLFNKSTVTMIYKESLGSEIPDIYEPEYQALELFYQKHRHLKLR